MPIPRVRLVDDPAQRGGVGGIEREPQIRERVLHLGAVVEAHAADHDVGDVAGEQLLFEDARLRVGAVEDRAVAVGPAVFAHERGDLAHDDLRLLAVVARLEQPDRVAALAVGEQLLALARDVVRDDPDAPARIGCVER